MPQAVYLRWPKFGTKRFCRISLSDSPVKESSKQFTFRIAISWVGDKKFLSSLEKGWRESIACVLVTGLPLGFRIRINSFWESIKLNWFSDVFIRILWNPSIFTAGDVVTSNNPLDCWKGSHYRIFNEWFCLQDGCHYRSILPLSRIDHQIIKFPWKSRSQFRWSAVDDKKRFHFRRF